MLLATGPRAEGTGVQEAGSGPASEPQMPGPWPVLWRAPGKEGGLLRAEASRQNARAGEGAAGGGGAEED